MAEEMTAAPVAEVVAPEIESPVESGVPNAGEPKVEAAPKGLKPEEVASLKPAEVTAKYKALTRKLKDDPNFKFTDEDAAVYDAHIRNKTAVPGPAPVEAVEPEEMEGDDEVAVEETPAEELEPQVAAIPEPWAPLLEKFGVKTPEELAAAVEDVHGKASEFFNDNKQMFQKITTQEQTLNAAHNILMGVIAGDPASIETARNIARQSGAKIPGLAADLSKIQDPNLRAAMIAIQQDNEALRAQQTKVLTAQEQHVQRMQQEHAQRTAQSNLTNEFTTLAAKAPNLGISPVEAQAGLQEFFKSGKLPEKLAPMMAIVQHADSKGISLEDAYKIMTYDQIPSMVQQAQVNGRKALLNQTPSKTLAGQKASSGEFREYTLDQVRSMYESYIDGKPTYPAAWTDNGIFRSNKAPKYVVNWINEFMRKS